MQSEARINAIIAPNKLWIISKNLNIEAKTKDGFDCEEMLSISTCVSCREI